MATKKLSPDAKAIYDAHADRGWVTWGGIKETLQTPDPLRISTAWNELTAAGLTSGQLSTGHQCKVFREPLA